MFTAWSEIKYLATKELLSLELSAVMTERTGLKIILAKKGRQVNRNYGYGAISTLRFTSLNICFF